MPDDVFMDNAFSLANWLQLVMPSESKQGKERDLDSRKLDSKFDKKFSHGTLVFKDLALIIFCICWKEQSPNILSL